MIKKFNETGLCFPDEHFMADISQKIDATYKMVEEGAYFIINRPRQYGKTTMLHTLADKLTESDDYMVFRISFEGISDQNFLNESFFGPGFIRLLAKSARSYAPDKRSELLAAMPTVTNLDDLSDFITDFVESTGKKVVLLIDEVDKSSNNQLFVSFLGMLRDKYLERRKVKTFHSVVLAGIHDIKSLKLKIRPDSEKKYNSPWNIATEFEVNMNLTPDEIKPMLEDYVQERGVKMDTQWMANRLFYFTSGYPYLVSKLCKIIDEKILSTKSAQPDAIETVKEWTEEDLNQAFHLILKEAWNANFDTVMKNLEDYPDLYELTFSVIFDGEAKQFSQSDPTVNLGVLHGIFAESESGHVVIQNRIYRERIANMMVSVWHTSNIGKFDPVSAGFDFRGSYRLPNGGLDMEKVMHNFQVFMRENHSDKDRKFLERDGRILFLAYLKPILNGSGYEFKEPQISDEKRLDIVIVYNQFKYVVELKLWYGAVAHEKGLQQLSDYLDRQGLQTGYLVIFDHSKKKSWKKDWTEVNGKRVLWAKV